MVIDERSRLALHKRLEELLGPTEAATLMEHLPPVGWADVATKRDLDQAQAATKRDLDQAQAATKRDLDEAQAATKRDLDEAQAATKRDLERLETKIEVEVQLLEAKIKADVQGQFVAFQRNIIAWTTGLNAALVGLVFAAAKLT